MTEDIIDLTSLWEIVAYAKAQPGVRLGAKHLRNVLEAVVSGITSARFDSYRSERQRNVVDKHKDVVDIDIFLILPVAHGVTAQIHIG